MVYAFFILFYKINDVQCINILMDYLISFFIGKLYPYQENYFNVYSIIFCKRRYYI